MSSGLQLPNPLDVTPQNIDSYKQNLPIYVIQDLQAFGVPPDATFKILLARGVQKWLACRKDFLGLKDTWRWTITSIQQSLYTGQHGSKSRDWWKGYLAALTECRQQVRTICHSPRWRAPDNDRWSTWFLSELKDE